MIETEITNDQGADSMTQSPTVLLVEDSPTQAQQIAAHLVEHALDVLIADDGPVALQIADEGQPDVIVLDINLPSMSGYQVCKRLKRDESTAHIPVIMLTVAGDSDHMLNGLEVGATDYIPKDEFAIENLIASLGSLGFIQQSTED
jgi:DNA-binding response OmpR family regulator